MNRHHFVLSLVAIVALLVATPIMGQVTNLPVLSLAPGSGYGTTSVGAAFSRGIQNGSWGNSVFVARVERGLETVSFGATVGYIASRADNFAVGGSVAAHVLRYSSMLVSLQSGLGWIRQPVLNLDLTTLHIPVGVSIQGTGFGKLRPWVMPRVSFVQTSGEAVAASNTDIEFGGSAGVSFASGVGVRFSLAYDFLNTSGVRRQQPAGERKTETARPARRTYRLRKNGRA